MLRQPMWKVLDREAWKKLFSHVRGSVNSYLTWPSIRRWLISVEEERFLIYSWSIPIIVMGLNAVNDIFDFGIKFPAEIRNFIGNLFFSAISYLVANTIYLFFCPLLIRGVRYDGDWYGLYSANLDGLNVAMESYQKAAITLENVASFNVNQAIKIEGEGGLSVEVLDAMRKSYLNRYLKDAGKMPPFMQQFLELSYENKKRMELSRPIPRILSALAIASAVAFSLREVVSKIIEVFHFSFN